MDIEGLLVVVYIADILKQGEGGILLVVVRCALLMIPFPVITTALYFFFIKSSYREFNVMLSDQNMFLEFYT